MAKIKVDTTALEKKLGTMNDKINAIKESIDDIDKEMQKVEKYWKGDASKLFLLNYAKTDISLGSMMDILTESKNEMQEICKKYNNCEQSVGDMIKSGIIWSSRRRFYRYSGSYHKWRRFKIHNRASRYSVPDNWGIFRTESEGCTGLFRGY